ncbi:medium-chain acyl-[acyl-carrier-protein] hydrolase [Streptacidiphilus sp. MAP12-33]|uniref:thioesterase II family protein n=1 Tax=Streptacidiphilus sp. MAP12-33 TaxID=3156266 RepID=UPI003517091C
MSTPYGTAHNANPWLTTLTPRPAARLRLVCFPPSGAGTNFYRPWAARLPQDVELLAVRLPGREDRYREALIEDYPTAVARLHTALRPVFDQPYALFGHSMGALLAYGVALASARLGAPAPVRLLLSGAGGPGTEPPKAGRGTWSDEEIVADLREMGGTPEAVLDHRELLDLILPVLRADYTLCDAFYADPPTSPLLDCPLTVLGGAKDHYTPQDLARWTRVSTGPATHHTYPGGHFFVVGESADAVLATLTTELAG